MTHLQVETEVKLQAPSQTSQTQEQIEDTVGVTIQARGTLTTEQVAEDVTKKVV